MKRIQLIAAALCLVMIVTVGAGVVAAKQTDPHQAGASSVYFFDVAATDAHGSGKLMINLDQHTFVFNGKDFKPSQQYSLQARAASGDAYVFAFGKSTPSGNLHVEGTWSTTAAAQPSSPGFGVVAGAYYLPLYGFQLQNVGWFIAKLACYYSTDSGVTWHESGHTSGIWSPEWGVATLDDLGVPFGALVKIHAIVEAGKDRTGSEVFQYYYTSAVESHHYANYYIYGTTGNPKLEYMGYYCCMA